jgi:hypothetical protein
VISIGAYIFVKGQDEANESDQGRFPWIAKVETILPRGKGLGVLWVYHPHTIPAARETYRGPYEIILSNHQDVIDLESVCGLARVKENCNDCRTRLRWCWKQTYDVHSRKLRSQVPSRKRRMKTGTQRRRVRKSPEHLDIEFTNTRALQDV